MDPSHSSAGGNSETGGPLQGQCRPSAVTQTLPCVLAWWRGCGPEEVSLIRTLIPPGGLHSHDLITSQSLHLPTLSPLWVRVSTCKHSDHSIDLLFFFFNIYLAASDLSRGMQDLPCTVPDLLLWRGLGTAREVLLPQPGFEPTSLYSKATS